LERAIVIVDHGSREAAANGIVVEIARLVQLRAAQTAVVCSAHMELAEPSLAGAIDDCVSAGAREIIVQPLFLAPGRHASRDIPEMLAEARQRHPHVSFHLGDVIGADPVLVDLISVRCGLS
jgi:sirohydrochlorin ferrochelatase